MGKKKQEVSVIYVPANANELWINNVVAQNKAMGVKTVIMRSGTQSIKENMENLIYHNTMY